MTIPIVLSLTEEENITNIEILLDENDGINDINIDLDQENINVTNIEILLDENDSINDINIDLDSDEVPSNSVSIIMSQKFDYIIVDTSNNNLYIVKNLSVAGSRSDNGLNSIDDYIHFSGSLSVDCAIPFSGTYTNWNSTDIYGKFSEGVIDTLSNFSWDGLGYNYTDIYDMDDGTIVAAPDCLF